MRKTTFWILLALIFVAGFFFVGLVAALAFVVSAILAPFLDKNLRGRTRGYSTFWILELVLSAALVFFVGGTIGFAWLAGAVVADILG